MAIKDGAPAVGLRPPDAPPGGDDRRARAAARPGRRRHRAPAGRRPARRRRRATSCAAPSSPGAWRRSASASGWRRSSSRVTDGGRAGRGLELALARRAARAGGAPALVASVGPLTCALVPGWPRTICSRSPSESWTRRRRGARGAGATAASGARWLPARTRAARSTRPAARSRRCPSPRVAGGDGAANGNGAGRHGAGAPAAGHLPRARLLPAAALAPGRRGAAAVLRLDPRADRAERGPLRRRADALARGVHRGERPVGARGAAAVLPPPHAALPDPPGGGADRAQPRRARATASSSGWHCEEGSW